MDPACAGVGRGMPCRIPMVERDPAAVLLFAWGIALGRGRRSVDIELHALRQRQGLAVVDGVGGAAHVVLPGVRTGFTA
ncbi:hypothetical protein ABTE96_19740, partial [Acinetobacter baumannii]